MTYPPDEHSQDDLTSDAPASVIFAEMMRRAAADRQPPPPDNAPAPPLDLPEDSSAAPSAIEARRQDAALETQRVLRFQRRQERRRQRAVGMIAGLVRAFMVVIISGGLIATILSWWTSPQSFPEKLRIELGQINPTGIPLIVPTAIPTPNYARRIGIISGHSGPENDPGAICEDVDGQVILTESEINATIAYLVWENLKDRGYTVDFLEELDSRLDGYTADLLVSIHSNDCVDYGEHVSGYLVGYAEARPPDSPDALLVECIAAHYAKSTGLQRRYDLTYDMTDYHVFRKINLMTPGAIIEIGFMRGDREFITGRTDLVAEGIINGILCFLDGGNDPLLIPTATPETLFFEETPTPDPADG